MTGRRANRQKTMQSSLRRNRKDINMMRMNSKIHRIHALVRRVHLGGPTASLTRILIQWENTFDLFSNSFL